MLNDDSAKEIRHNGFKMVRIDTFVRLTTRSYYRKLYNSTFFMRCLLMMLEHILRGKLPVFWLRLEIQHCLWHQTS